MPPVTRSKAKGASEESAINLEDWSPQPFHFDPDTRSATRSSIHTDDGFTDTPPVYTIDLSLPPDQRYVEVAKELKTVVTGLTALFDDLMEDAGLPKKTIHFLSRMVFRRLYSKEQHLELKGFHRVTGVPMYLLIAFNVLLDFFMGCTSGGIVVKEQGSNAKRMMHFRTLDWGMEALREALVQFEYKMSPDGPVIARVINYVGYVGIVTGVREGLSVSLNFRPYHNNDHSKIANGKFYGNQLLILLGLRPSISSNLRQLILPSTTESKRRKGLNCTSTLADIPRYLPSIPSTASYLIFCDGEQTLILEKDRKTAKSLTSSSFLACTNHDISYESTSSTAANHASYAKSHKFGAGMEEIVAESMERKKCLTSLWEKRKKKSGWVTVEMLKEWLATYPITNEETHFATVMDPANGEVVWVRQYAEGEVRDWRESSSDEE